MKIQTRPTNDLSILCPNRAVITANQIAAVDVINKSMGNTIAYKPVYLSSETLQAVPSAKSVGFSKLKVTDSYVLLISALLCAGHKTSVS